MKDAAKLQLALTCRKFILKDVIMIREIYQKNARDHMFVSMLCICPYIGWVARHMWVHMLKQTQSHTHLHIIERIITPLQILQTWSNEVLFSQTVWKVNSISVLVMVGSGAVCMYYLHLSDVVIEARCCYESGWEANKCVYSLLMLKSDPVCTYLLWAACCLCP